MLVRAQWSESYIFPKNFTTSNLLPVLVLEEKGKELSDMTLSEMDVYWEEAKKIVQ